MAVYRLTEQATIDLSRIYEYGIDTFGLTRARLYLDALYRRLSEIADHPLQWPAVEEVRPGYRRSVCAAHSIYYRMIDGDVEIVRVLGRQAFEDELGAI